MLAKTATQRRSLLVQQLSLLMILVSIPGYTEMKNGWIRATFVLATTVMSGLAGAQDADPTDLHAGDGDSHESRPIIGQFVSNLVSGPRSSSLDKSGGENRLTLGDRFWVGPRWEERTGNDGSFPLQGEIDGIVIGARTRNVDALFISMEAIWLNGAFELTSGDLTDYNEFQLETLVGKTWEHETCNVFITPYTGLRYRDADNILRSASFNADVTQHRWDAPFGIRSDYLFSDNIAVGLDSRIQWKFQDKQVVDIVDSSTDIIQDTKSRLTYRIQIPITFRLGARGELALRPYYEWDRFDATDGSRSTSIREDGLDLTYLITF